MSIEATIMGYFHEYDAKARALYPAYAARPVPKVSFFAKGRMNGWAKQGSWEVQFNTHNASQVPEEFRNTVSHEIAHMVDYALRGRSGHDRIWKAIHRSLGGTGTRCSQYGITVKRGRVKNEYLYRNANGAETWAGPKHHAAMQRCSIAGIRNRSGQVFNRNDWTGQRRTIG
ncbi:SprT-like protein [Xanthomonas phage XacN1]|nr:SprT-like protein [Xanthomonas phage XacN1]BBA65652.1 SprT-like protein [Xanthomonas phage XacN1]